MFQNVLLFIHLKMFKIGCMLNVIYYNKLCVIAQHAVLCDPEQQFTW